MEQGASPSAELTTRLQKGGALLSDLRQLVTQWRQLAEDERPTTVVAGILQKATHARAADTYRRAFYPRMLRGSPRSAWQIARAVEDAQPALETVRPIYYWITARAEPLLYKFVTEELLQKSVSNENEVRISETVAWVAKTVASAGKQWSPTVRVKVARGLLAALRDFGLLEGSTRKKIAPRHLSLEAFCLIAFWLNRLEHDSRALVRHPDWELFLLNQTAVESLFLEAHQNGWLNYQAAGGIHRVEFPTEDFREYVHAVLGRKP
jgi:hypothetical protein